MKTETLESRLKLPVLVAAITLATWCGGCPRNEGVAEGSSAVMYNGDGTYSPAPKKDLDKYSMN